MFLDDIDLDGVKAAKIKRSMSNWMKVADIIYEGVTEQDLLIMLKIELTSKGREYVIQRLHSRYNAVRSKREKGELLAWMRG